MKVISKSRFNYIIEKFSTISPIVVVGDVGVDKYTYGNVNRISPEAPVPVLEVTKEWNKLGLAANVSDNLNSLKVKSSLCSVIGDDNNANVVIELLKEQDLSSEGLVKDSKRLTTFKERVTTNSQQICRVDYETKEDLSPETEALVLNKVQAESINSQALILEDYGKGFVTQTLSSQLIGMFREQNKLVCVDPSRKTNPLWYKGATLLKPNFLESQLMAAHLGYQTDSVEEIIKILIDKLELEKIVVTLGAQGMALVDSKEDGQIKYIPTVASEVFDVSGAGDTAISVITSSLVAGASLEEACWVGNCASGIVIRKRGTARVDQNELINFYPEMVRNISE
jgi:rfaE bifunctional protein kinase chain/domain